MVLALVSHFTTRGLIRREVLCAPQACYAFAERWGNAAARPWPSVTRELRWMAALVCLAFRDLGAEWSERVHTFDASAWGVGVVSKRVPKAQIQELA
eukprot:8379488-Lingulodinium_polyedra.AAC.1